MAFDFGERRIGLATGSSVTGTSSPLTTLAARLGIPDWSELDKLVNEWTPDLLIVGLPYNMDGSDSAMTEKALEFSNILGQRYNLPVDNVDERLTSVEASGLLKEQRRIGLRKKKVKRGDLDSLSACLIAESWMQQNRTKNADTND
jgi:putative Holliday junction resolvase